MKILFHLAHPAQYHMFKNVIENLKQKGHKIKITINTKDIYRAINRHLISNSYTLHDIELYSHGLSKKINGHYSISPLIWKIIHGKRSYFLNRWQTANHTDSITANNFVIVKTEENFRNVKEKEENIPYGLVLLARKNKE